MILKKYFSFTLVCVVTFLTPAVLHAQQNTSGDNIPNDYIECVDLINRLSLKSTDRNSGGEVSALQDFLNPAYLSFEPNGIFGRETLNAVMAFQKKNNISPVGFVGPVTRAKIKEISCEKNQVILPVTGLNWEYPNAKISPVDISFSKLENILSGKTPPYYANVGALTSSGVLAGVLRIAETKDPRYPYIGLFHTNLGNNIFEIRLSSSKDLKTWTTLKAVSKEAGMPDMIVLPDNSLLYAEETSIVGRVPFIKVRHFKTVEKFIEDPKNPDAEMVLPNMPNSWADGTPRFGRITYSGDIYNSKIEITHHYFKPPAPGQEQRDQQVSGVLVNFRNWAGTEDMSTNTALARIGYIDIGDRDFMQVGDTVYQIMEGRPSQGIGWASWKIFLINKNTGEIRKLDTQFPGGSYSPANPKTTFLTLPDGRKAIAVTYYVFYGGSIHTSGPHLFVYPLE